MFPPFENSMAPASAAAEKEINVGVTLKVVVVPFVIEKLLIVPLLVVPSLVSVSDPPSLFTAILL